MVTHGLSLFAALTVVTILAISNCQDVNYMIKYGVVPEIIDKPPPGSLEVVYPNNVKVEEGNKLTPTQVKDQPAVKWPSEDGSYYFLLMVDPDVPSRQQRIDPDLQHWLVGNIPGNDISKGETITEYIGSAPRKCCGFHRYVLLLYKQANKISFSEKKLNSRSPGAERLGFSVRNFTKKYNLGDPVAGNLYRAKWDNYVPTLQRQIGISTTAVCPFI